MLLTNEQYIFVAENLHMKPTELAKELGITRKQAVNIKSAYKQKMRRMKTNNSLLAIPKQSKPKQLWRPKFNLNPNEPTLITEMLICRYYYKCGDIEDISLELGRTKEFIRDTLDRCMQNGNYEAYNSYGRC